MLLLRSLSKLPILSKIVYSENQISSGKDTAIISNPRALLLSCLGLLFVCVLVYWPVLFHKFQTQWDDQWEVINYYTDRGLDKDNLWDVLTEFYHGQYAPVNEFYYILLFSAFGYNPFWFHLGSLLIHAANSILVYLTLRKLLIHLKEFEYNSIQRISIFTALLLAVHPLMVESVAWVAASKVILYIFFYLFGLYFYLFYLTNNKVRYLILFTTSFILSFGAKEQAVTFPVCLLLLDYITKRDMRDKKVWLEKLPLFVLSILFGIVTMFSQADTQEGVLSDESLYPFYQNILFGSYSLVEYIIKILFPIKLSYLYTFPNPVGSPVPTRFWVYPFIIAFLCFSLWDFWKKKYVFFGVFFFLIHIGLVLHIIPLSRFAIIADRYVYLSSIGIFFILSLYMDKYMTRNNKHAFVFLIFLVMYLVTLGTYAHKRSLVWQDSESLKEEIRHIIQERNKQEKPRG